MTLIEQMRRTSFTQAKQQVVDYLLSHLDDLAGLSLDDLAKSYKEAKEKLAFAKAQVEHERSKPPSEMYISEWFEKWLSTQKHIKNSSYSVYSSLIKQHIVKRLGKLRLCNITKDN